MPKGPFGDNKVFKFNEVDPAGTAISATCKYPEVAMKWMDYQFSRQGKILSWMGIEGESFEYNAEGKPIYTEDYKNMNNDYKLGVKFLPLMDSLQEAHLQRLQNNKNTWDGIQKNINQNETYFPALRYTKDELATLRKVGPDLVTFVAEQTDKFIMGARDMSEWGDFTNTLQKLKVDDYEKIYNEAYKRFLQ